MPHQRTSEHERNSMSWMRGTGIDILEHIRVKKVGGKVTDPYLDVEGVFVRLPHLLRHSNFKPVLGFTDKTNSGRLHQNARTDRQCTTGPLDTVPLY